MRTIVAAAFIAAATLTGVAQAADPQVAAKLDGDVILVAEALTASDARRIARDYIKDQDMRNARVGEIRQRQGKFHVQLTSPEGFPISQIVIDSQTGKVEGKENSQAAKG